MKPTWYEIRIREALNPGWEEWFAGMSILQEKEGNTILSGPVADQAALFGVLMRIQSLNLTLLSVEPVQPPDPPAARKTNEENET